MSFDQNFDPDGIDGIHIENPMDAGEDDQVAELRKHLYAESQAILAQTREVVGTAAKATGRSGVLEQLTDAQDGLIHALIDVHTLIHLEMGR